MKYLFNAVDIATYLGITTTTIQNWKNDPDKKFDEVYDDENPRKIDVIKLLRWLYNWKCEVEDNKSEASDRKKLADAMLAELKYKKQAEILVPKSSYLLQEKERMILLKSMTMMIAEQLAGTLKLSPIQKEEVLSVCRSNLVMLKKTFEGREKDWLECINAEMKNEIENIEKSSKLDIEDSDA